MNIILDILGLFLLYILITALWRGWQLWRQFRRMQRFVNDPYGKKIPHGTGEYIDFTEVTLSAEELRQRYERRTQTVRTEEQITDIKWVDLP